MILYTRILYYFGGDAFSVKICFQNFCSGKTGIKHVAYRHLYVLVYNHYVCYNIILYYNMLVSLNRVFKSSSICYRVYDNMRRKELVKQTSNRQIPLHVLVITYRDCQTYRPRGLANNNNNNILKLLLPMRNVRFTNAKRRGFVSYSEGITHILTDASACRLYKI